MSDGSQWRRIAHQGFLFSGVVTAAVTHEIRNKLAIVNEKAGLIEDLAAMAARGRPLDPTELAQQARGIRDHIRAADDVVGRLNRFAHSADHPHLRADTVQLVDLVIELSGRRAASAGVRLELDRPDQPLPLTTLPFLFEHLVFLCVGLVLSCADQSREVAVSIQAEAGGVSVRFSGLEQAEDHLAELEAKTETAALLAAVRATLRPAEGGAGIILQAKDLAGTDEDRPQSK